MAQASVRQYMDRVSGGMDTARSSNMLYAPLPMLVFDVATGEILWCNDMFTDLTGLKDVTDNVSAINPDDIKNGMTIDVDFFITSTAGKEPAKDTSSDPIWFPNNTASLAGLTLKDLGIVDDWHAIVPVDLSKTGWQTFPLLAANFKQVGTAYVAVNNGSVTVTCEYNGFYVFEKSQCIKWFTSLDQISKAKLVDISNGLDCGSVVSIADDLGGAQMAYLSINNKITWRNPVDDFGNSLPDYWKNLPQWKEYRANLMEMINAANAE